MSVSGAHAPVEPSPSVPSRSGISEQTILLCCLIGATQMTWGSVVPALPLYADRFGASALILGPIIAAFGVGRVIANIPAGLALRWWHPRPYLWAVCLLLALVTSVTGFSPDPGVLIVARVFAGLFGGAAVTVGFAALVARASADRRGRVMATATAVQMSAGAIGALVGGLALTCFTLEVAFAVAVVPLLLCLLWDAVRPATHYWQSLRPSDPAPSVAVRADTPWSRDSPSGTFRLRSAALASTVVALAVASFAAFFARFGGEQGLTPVLGYDRGGLTPLTLGFALAAATMVSLAAMPVVGRLIDRGYRLSVLIPGTLLAAVALLLYPAANGPWQFAAIVVLYGVASSAAGVVPSVIMSESVPKHLSGFVVGVTRTAGDIGAVAGPLVAFAVYDSFGAWSAVAAIAAVLVVANAFLIRVARSSRTLPIP
ncbi:MFS family permease [Conyzicola lurida]|uniref:MFS family permease n=1 Tax=Conyzicola lurida TaxID=1172621 RepID=A0A841APG4_9MICO|nr:MFS family permease [Conyzicola lurida]